MDSIRLSPSAQKMMSRAVDESGRLEHHFLGVEHIFLALVEDSASPLTDAFSQQDVDTGRFSETLRKRVIPVEHRPWGSDLLITPRCQRVLQLSSKIAARNKSPQVNEHHIIEAIFREGRSVPVRLLQNFDIEVADLYDVLTPPATAEPVDTETPTLNRFGRDLTTQARLGTLMPVIGRAAEMNLMAQVLLRKNKNNPVLVGEAGVGKTAVVEGFATLLASDDCPAPLEGSRIIELSVASLVAGTKFRGQFEERLMNIMKEAASDPHIILFLDEVHTLVGAGSSGGESLDASNIFKPALARGELRCIGATTVEEYRRHIEKDAALERRFEPIMVEEPSPAEAREILDGLMPAFADHHQVTIKAEAMQAALDLTVRYLPNRQLPDKAIDALDQTCARVRLQALTGGGDGVVAAPSVDADSITVTVSQWTGIPLERISGAEAENLLHLEDRLRERVVGQKHAAKAVARSIITAKAGLSDPKRPSGVFLFLGPTGVGKTELAKSLAELLFGDDKRLIRFDMSEYTEAHSVAKLIGSPPGYVGHEKEGLLISAVRTHPHAVVLFDELEKAHNQVYDLFLQIFDEGRLAGAHGAKADFRHAIIILTSNLDTGLDEKQKASLGFASEGAKTAVPADPRIKLTKHLRPELVNRIDNIVIFNKLGRDDLRLIIDRYIREIEELAATRQLKLDLDDSVYDFLIDSGVSDKFGARELRRSVDHHLRQPLAEEVLKRGDQVGTIKVTKGDRALVLT